jgi:hypothetical protein
MVSEIICWLAKFFVQEQKDKNVRMYGGSVMWFKMFRKRLMERWLVVEWVDNRWQAGMASAWGETNQDRWVGLWGMNPVRQAAKPPCPLVKVTACQLVAVESDLIVVKGTIDHMTLGAMALLCRVTWARPNWNYDVGPILLCIHESSPNRHLCESTETLQGPHLWVFVKLVWASVLQVS